MLVPPQDINQQHMFISMVDLLPANSDIPYLDGLITKIKERRKDLFDSTGQSYTGRPAYMFETLLKIYIYGCLNRINSSRRLERETYRNIELIVLTGNLHPDHKTISDFRKDNKASIKEISKEIKKLLNEHGLIGEERLTIDGTKIKGNAGKDMQHIKDLTLYLQTLETEMDIYLARVSCEDEQDTSELSIQLDDYKQKINTMSHEIESLREQIKELHNQGQNYVSHIDSDCNKMKSRYGTIPGYNVQFGTDSKHKFIVYDEVVTAANDIKELAPSLETVKEELGISYAEVLADTGYCNMDMIETIESTGTKCYVSHPKEQGKKEGMEFQYDEKNDKYICPAGKELKKIRDNKKSKNSLVSDYRCKECTDCPLRAECTTSKTGRTISRYHNQKFRDSHREAMTSARAKELIRKRKGEIEHINAILKVWLGKIPLLTRGKENVSTEIDIFVISYNLNHLKNIMPMNEIIDKLGLKIRIKSCYFLILSNFYVILVIAYIAEKKIYTRINLGKNYWTGF